MKRLAGSNKSWGAGGKCQDSCGSAEMRQRSYERPCVRTKRWADWYWM